MTVCVCVWIVCAIVHESDVDRSDCFGLVLLHCRRRLHRRCLGSFVRLLPPRCLPPKMTTIGNASFSSFSSSSSFLSLPRPPLPRRCQSHALPAPSPSPFPSQSSGFLPVGGVAVLPPTIRVHGSRFPLPSLSCSLPPPSLLLCVTSPPPITLNKGGRWRRRRRRRRQSPAEWTPEPRRARARWWGGRRRVGDGAIGSRRMEHPRGKTKEGGAIPSMGAGSGKGRSSAGSEEGGGSRKRRGGEAAAVDANRWGRDGAANGEMIWSNAKEKEKGFLQVKMSLR